MKALRDKFREIFDPALQTGARLYGLRAFNTAAPVLWGIFIGVVALYFGRVNYDIELFYSYFEKPLIAFLNVVPLVLISGLLFLITNRMWAAFLGSSLLGIVPVLVNYYKIVLRGDPLMFSDVMLFSEAAEFGARYGIPVYPVMYLAAAAVVFGTLAAAIVLRARMKLPNRLWLAAVLLVGCAVLYGRVYINDDIYVEMYNMSVELPTKILSEWSLADQFVSRGFVYPFIFSSSYIDEDPPEGYIKDESRVMLEAFGREGIPDGEKVNIIGVMLEAFSDLTVFDEIGFVRDPIPFWHELQAKAVSGNLVTNIFAGGTPDTERGFLTGNVSLYSPRSATGSYVRYFKNEGYRTQYCHPGVSWVYNRRSINNSLGFDSDYFQEDRYDYYNDGTMILDEMFLPDILTLLDESLAAGESYFNFSLTYQNHAPYADDFLYESEVFIERNELSGAAYNILTNYLWSLSLTDASLRSLVCELEARQDPVVAVFFGDHKPWLGDGMLAYKELGISLDGDEGFYNKYDTPYLIWANADAKEALGIELQGSGGDISPMFLMPLLFDCLGWEGDEFIRAARELREYVDVVHSSGVVRENGVITGEPSAEAQAALDKYLKMEYYRRRDTVYR